MFAGEHAGGGAHLLRDGLLLLPLALAAALWGLRSPRGVRPAAARIAALFGGMLIPATAAHDGLHADDATSTAHAASTGAGAIGMPGEGDALAGALLHAGLDALLAVPLAFVLSLGVLALLFGRGERAGVSAGRPRLLVLGASTLVVAGAGAIVPVSGAASPPYPKFSTALKIPPVLTGQDISIDIAQTQQQILPGSTTTMWTYDGSFPGPIIRRPAGAPTNVTFTNNLPASAGSLSVHHHGTQAPEADDGHPSRYLIAPGTSRTYTYPGIDNGAPERAAPQWYHDHRDMVTGRNVWMGLLGAFIYDDPLEQSLDLPQGAYDVPLMVTDRQFDADNQIPYTFVSSGTFGDVILVNGVPQPFFEVGDRRYRFRLYNVSNRRDYTFQLSNGQAMTQIGTDSGLLPAPISRTSIRLGPAERADVVVDFAGHLGEEIVLQNADAALRPGRPRRRGHAVPRRAGRDRRQLAGAGDAAPGVRDRCAGDDAHLEPRPHRRRVDDQRQRLRSRPRGRPARARHDGALDLPQSDHAAPRRSRPPRRSEARQPQRAAAAAVRARQGVLVSRPRRRGRRRHQVRRLPRQVRLPLPRARARGPVDDDPVRDRAAGGVAPSAAAAPPPPAPPPPGGAPAPPVAAPPAPGGVAAPALPALSRAIRILSPKRLRHIVSRGLRFESAVAVSGATLRAELRARGRRVGSVRRTRLPRGRVKVTLTLSRAEKARLRRLMAGRTRVAAQLEVRSAGETRVARFRIWR